MLQTVQPSMKWLKQVPMLLSLSLSLSLPVSSGSSDKNAHCKCVFMRYTFSIFENSCPILALPIGFLLKTRSYRRAKYYWDSISMLYTERHYTGAIKSIFL